MFKKEVEPIKNILSKLLREQGLETPLQQRRLMESWDSVTGPMVARHTKQKFIKNQTLYVKIDNAALRQELSMRRTQLVQRLNAPFGTLIISDIHIY